MKLCRASFYCFSALLYFFVVILGGELFINLFTDYRTTKLAFHPEYGWTYNPHAREINSSGFRADNFNELPQAKNRILVLGDSYTAGLEVPVDRTFSSLLQAKLGGGYRVINAGISA